MGREDGGGCCKAAAAAEARAAQPAVGKGVTSWITSLGGRRSRGAALTRPALEAIERWSVCWVLLRSGVSSRLPLESIAPGRRALCLTGRAPLSTQSLTSFASVLLSWPQRDGRGGRRHERGACSARLQSAPLRRSIRRGRLKPFTLSRREASARERVASAWLRRNSDIGVVRKKCPIQLID